MKKWLAGFVLFFSSFVVQASTPDEALDLVKKISNEMLTTLQQQKSSLKGHPEKIVPIVNQLLLPYADIDSMTRAVLAKNWNNATAQQRKRFSEELTKLVVRTYAAAFEQYSDQTIDFLKPVPIGSTGDKVEIKSVIKQHNGPAIPVNYRLAKNNGAWKFYDINVDGVSLVASYRSQFSSQIAQKGIDNVIDMIAKRNAGN